MPNTPTITEADILAEIVGADKSGLTRETAESLLAFKFSAPATKQIRRLLQRNNRGSITAQERMTLEKYLRVGKFLELVHAKARLALKHSADSR